MRPLIRIGLATLALLLFALPGMEGVVIGQTDPVLPTYQGTSSCTGRTILVDEAGQGFLVIGQNDGTPWPGLVTLLNGASPDATEAYIKDLRAHGITVSRIMIEYAQEPYTYLEDPVGTFNPSVVEFWDQFIALAEKHGLYLLLTPYDTFWQAKNWNRYPYNSARRAVCVHARVAHRRGVYHCAREPLALHPRSLGRITKHLRVGS